MNKKCNITKEKARFLDLFFSPSTIKEIQENLFDKEQKKSHNYKAIAEQLDISPNAIATFFQGKRKLGKCSMAKLYDYVQTFK